MRLSNKLLFSLCGMALVFCAIPLLSEADSIQLPSGPWAGTGTGSYNFPGNTIYPFQQWSGVVSKDILKFAGSWSDSSGNAGTFKGSFLSAPNLNTFIYKGYWTWNGNPGGAKASMGKFQMTFDTSTHTCTGIWTGTAPLGSGTMTGS